jgi:hypothetical protein
VTIVGIETRSDGTSENVTIVGMASLTGLGVGGGPVKPPLGIWGGKPPEYVDIGGPAPQPKPEHPIVLPPPNGGPPPEIWPSPGHPSHPIVLPPIDNLPPPGGQPDDDGFVKPPPADGGWAYHQEYGWGLYPKPGEAGPKASGAR